MDMNITDNDNNNTNDNTNDNKGDCVHLTKLRIIMLQNALRELAEIIIKDYPKDDKKHILALKHKHKADIDFYGDRDRWMI